MAEVQNLDHQAGDQQHPERQDHVVTRRDMLRKTAWVVPAIMAQGVIVDDAVAGASGAGGGKYDTKVHKWKKKKDEWEDKKDELEDKWKDVLDDILKKLKKLFG